MTQKELITKKDYAAIGEEIGHEKGIDFVKAYNEAHPADFAGYTMGRNIIDQILAQPGCVGMRFYNALNEEGRKTLVYVGIDAEGKDLIKKTVIQQDGKLGYAGIVADRLDFWEWLLGGGK